MPRAPEEPTVIDGPLSDEQGPSNDTLRQGHAPVVDDAPLSEIPASVSTARSESSAASQSESLTQTLAVRDEHAARGRGIVGIGVVGGALMAFAIQIPDRRPPGHWAATIALVVVSVISAGILLAARNRRGVDSGRVFALGVLTSLAILVVIYYTGPFSPASLALFLGVYYFGLGDSRVHSWVIFSICTLGYIVLALAAILGAYDPSLTLLPLAPTSTLVQAIATLVVSSFLTLTFWLARLSRSATLKAMAELENKERQLRQREALLDEARADLNHVLDAGRTGRLSGRSVGPFVLDEIVGRGAMGEVYAAVDGRSAMPAAVKLLHTHVLDEPTHVQRFFREAEVVGALESPHVVRVIGSGFAEDGSPYIAMERLIGHDLAWHLRQRRRLRISDVLDLVAQVSQALAVAQDAGIVHRDLKPQNLFLHESSSARLWKVLDFGVSKITSAASTLTGGAAVGTPSYMSPEQARGHDVDQRADIFGLGVIAYRCLTGRPAFTGADPLTTMYNVAHLQPARPRDHVPVHEDIELALAIAIAKKRERRYPSAQTFAAALRDASRGQLDERLRRDARELLNEHPWGIDDAERPEIRGSSEARKSRPDTRKSHGY